MVLERSTAGDTASPETRSSALRGRGRGGSDVVKLAVVPSATVLGVEGRPVRVEVHVSQGLPAFAVVGLPDAACREARDRVRAAVTTSGAPWPIAADHGEPGAVVAAQGRAAASTSPSPSASWWPRARSALEKVAGMGFVGELGLDGAVRAVAGAVPLVDALDTAIAVVPVEGAAEARLVGRHDVRPVATLRELVAALADEAPWPDHPAPPLTGSVPPRGRPGRRPRPAGGPPRPRARRRRRPQPAARRAPGRRQDDARPAAPGHPAAALGRRGAAGHPRPLGGRRPPRRPAASSPGPRSGRRTTPRRWCRWSAAAPPRCGRAS